MIMDQPLKIRLMPTITPKTQAAVLGHSPRIIRPRSMLMAALNSTQVQPLWARMRKAITARTPPSARSAQAKSRVRLKAEKNGMGQHHDPGQAVDHAHQGAPKYVFPALGLECVDKLRRPGDHENPAQYQGDGQGKRRGNSHGHRAHQDQRNAQAHEPTPFFLDRTGSGIAAHVTRHFPFTPISQPSVKSNVSLFDHGRIGCAVSRGSAQSPGMLLKKAAVPAAHGGHQKRRHQHGGRQGDYGQRNQQG